jgi:hypothetical protein
MVTTNLAWDDMINVHLTLICATDLTHSTITLEHSFTLLSVPTRVQLINSHYLALNVLPLASIES